MICEFGPEGPVLFREPEELVTADRPADLLPALARLEEARRQGSWIAGWIAYEAGYVLDDRLAALTPPDAGPLLVFGIHDGPGEPDPEFPEEDVRLAPLTPSITREEYRAAFTRVQDHIRAGDCRQVNLTFPLESRLEAGSPPGLYRALAAEQPVGYGSYADLGHGPIIVSRSPELFIRMHADGLIEARPMKGTAARDSDPQRDAALAAELAASQKNRAENLMIVELLRDEIGGISRAGSVRVPELCAVESFATVHQMSSRVTGRLAEPANLVVLLQALFPCGSITGTPKTRAMEIIREVEPFSRGVYCGALGWMAPDGSGCFSVAIRTLSVERDGRVTLNVGGGIVEGSTADAEWEEALWKTRFAEALTTRH